MKSFRAASSLIPTLALAVLTSPMLVSAQTAGQDVKNAGTDTKNAAKSTGNAVKKGTTKTADKTKEGGTVAVDKTKETSVKAYDRSEEGVKKVVDPDSHASTKAKNRANESGPLHFVQTFCPCCRNSVPRVDFPIRSHGFRHAERIGLFFFCSDSASSHD